jgi:hypothetical protein
MEFYSSNAHRFSIYALVAMVAPLAPFIAWTWWIGKSPLLLVVVWFWVVYAVVRRVFVLATRPVARFADSSITIVGWFGREYSVDLSRPFSVELGDSYCHIKQDGQLVTLYPIMLGEQLGEVLLILCSSIGYVSED